MDLRELCSESPRSLAKRLPKDELLIVSSIAKPEPVTVVSHPFVAVVLEDTTENEAAGSTVTALPTVQGSGVTTKCLIGRRGQPRRPNLRRRSLRRQAGRLAGGHRGGRLDE